MGSPLSLTHAEAKSKADTMHQTVQSIAGKLTEIKNSVDEMVRSTWKGDASSLYFQQSSSQTDDFDVLIKTLTELVNKAETHMNSVASNDGAR
ncbi:WXG100 family type VII secretion target [Mycobacteroides sp. LB1]|uniref:WXG100 family type VII secretion target n=1 Tax=Mycobacteroides sp. LB1 TaxID=2750814 RepID=UPI0015DDE714|nr:WXG100 family type VII secretion target [Mycobacteroides sp. LB1]MBA0047879.1 WXG100 family type VII secretion target [Mycobacteroides sp. LB1]